MTRCGLDGPFGPRPTVPHQLWGMSREEIVKALMDEGFSPKMAERDAGGFLAYRDTAKEQPSQEEDAGKDSVSGMSIRERIQVAFGRRGSSDEVAMLGASTKTTLGTAPLDPTSAARTEGISRCGSESCAPRCPPGPAPPGRPLGRPATRRSCRCSGGAPSR